MAPSQINNLARELIKDSRDSWNDKEWFILGDADSSTTFSYASASSITVASDITSSHHVGRRVKIVGSNTGTIFGKIATSSFSSPNTTLTFTFDSSSISSSDSTVDVYVGSTFVNPATPVVDEDDMASDNALVAPSQQSVKAYVDSGTTTLTNKTFNLANNTLTGTKAQFNSAVSDDNFATISGAETLTNKTLTSPIISSISNTGTVTLPTASDTLVGRSTTDTLNNKTLATPVINQISNTGTLSLPTSTDTLVGKATTDTLSNKSISGSANTLSNIATTSLTGTITNAQLSGSITTDKISDSQITTAKINDDAVTIDKIADGVIVTNSEASGHSVDDNTFFTTSASDSRYFRQDSSETITSGVTWSSSDNFVATTSAIDARVIDLVDDVGGFVPIANETSFPNTNPDVNNGAGTIVSIKGLSQALTANGSGVITIANGTVGNSTVTLNGLSASQTLGSGFGILVETTTTLNTYTFHRQIAPATSTSTLAGIATEIGRLGTTDAIADMNLLGTTANVTAMSNVSDSITNVNSVASGLTNVNTVASNISGVNSFGERYRVASSAPSASLDSGDLYFDTSTNILKVYGASGWQSAGSSVNGTSDRFKFTVSGTPTTLSGNDDNSKTLSYDAGFIDVYLNGVRMVNGVDVTVTSGSSLVFSNSLANGDVVEAVAFGTFSVASLNASNLDSGTVNNARLPSTISDKTINASTPLTVKGDGSSVDGSITLNCHVNSHGVKIMSPPHSAGQSYTIKLPDNQIAQDKFMKVKSISGSGSTAIGQLEFADVDLANLNASNLTSGTLPDARFPATLPASNGSALTNLTSANLTGALPAIDGSALTGISAGSVNLTAGADVTLGDVVEVTATGTVRPVLNDGPLVSNEATVSSSLAQYHTRVVVLEDNKYFAVFSDSGSTIIKGVIITNSNGTISVGTPVTVKNTSTTDGDKIELITLSSSLVVMGDVTTDGYDTFTAISISGSTITAGTPVAGYSGGNGNTYDICKLDSTKFFFAHTEALGTSRSPKCRVGSVSGTSISFGTEYDTGTSIQYSHAGNIRLTPIDSTHVFFAWSRWASYTAWGSFMTVSGTSISAQTTLSQLSPSGSHLILGGFKLDNDYMALAVRSDIIKFFLIPIDYTTGATVSQTISFAGERIDINDFGGGVDSNGKITFGGRSMHSTSNGTLRMATVSYDPTAGTQRLIANSMLEISSSVFEISGTGADALDGTGIIVARDDVNSSVKAFAFNPSLIETVNRFIGVAGETFTNTNNGKVVHTGGVVEGLSGLTIGKNYYVSLSTGALTTTKNDFPVGKAISASKLLITHTGVLN